MADTSLLETKQIPQWAIVAAIGIFGGSGSVSVVQTSSIQESLKDMRHELKEISKLHTTMLIELEATKLHVAENGRRVVLIEQRERQK